MIVQKRNAGFTFIEMLVVITIIAVITAIGVVNFRAANQKARDGKRKGDLEQIRVALELFYTDEGYYLNQVSSFSVPDPITSATTVYMENVPQDPRSGYKYYYRRPDSATKTYFLCAHLESKMDSDPDCPDGNWRNCGEDINGNNIKCNYGVKNPL